jgi:hypothetical protein
MEPLSRTPGGGPEVVEAGDGPTGPTLAAPLIPDACVSGGRFPP